MNVEFVSRVQVCVSINIPIYVFINNALKLCMQEYIVPALIANPRANVWMEVTPGSGATLAGVISVCHKIDFTKNHVHALFIVENNESAIQVSTRMARCGVFKNINIGLAVHTDKGKK